MPRLLSLLLLGAPLALMGCMAPVPQSVPLPQHTVAVVASPSVPSVRPPLDRVEKLRIHAHPTHPTVAYEPVAGCTSWNTAYAMHAMAGKYECAALYTPGNLTAYRFVVFRDANGLAYTTGRDGRWVRNPAYDGYVAGDQPHR